jgi:hypothetical protein
MEFLGIEISVHCKENFLIELRMKKVSYQAGKEKT